MTELEKLRKKIERALNKQMKEKKLDQHAHYKDLAKDYLSLWDIKNKLIEDIEKRGVSVFWANGGGQQGYKKNESISELLKVNKQMLSILYDLGIRASDLKVVDEDEEL
ncbi:hypothetical protein HNQ80_001057 [Anaerosolibacter carboniphilus]|uniref:RNA polymerase subunit sigma-70 n=1 Tax=Anaerosolibacter carboniphilus TaxID=1417629 RepID=A0A841KVM3_9FIRM|nr:RNA polymerase subunit sigma-70 [Anaerosolibacter carboniphilus]MBB6214972.1 hypothetical protein [Anaerosolibacter carboniphilus]